MWGVDGYLIQKFWVDVILAVEAKQPSLSLCHPVTGFSQRTSDHLTTHTISCHIVFSGWLCWVFFSPCRITLFFTNVYQMNMMSVTVSCQPFRWKAVSL